MKIKNKKGMTLIELIVAISIMTIVMTGSSMMLVRLWDGRVNEVKMGQSSLLASQSVTEMIKNIRKSSQADSGAYFLDSGDDFEIIFYSDIDNDDHMERVHYYVEGSELKVGTAEPILGINPTYPEDDEVVSVLSDYLVNEEAEPLFTYYDSNGAIVDTPVQSSYVTLVRVTIHINVDPDNIGDTVISSSASFRNIDT
ncbi:type II secretion system protein J [Patescibacteria group bacterium]